MLCNTNIFSQRVELSILSPCRSPGEGTVSSPIMFPPSSTGCSTANEDHCLSRPSWGPGVASRHSRGTGRGSRLCRRAGRESICSRGTMNGRSRGAGNGSRRYRGAGSWRMCSRGAGSRNQLPTQMTKFKSLLNKP